METASAMQQPSNLAAPSWSSSNLLNDYELRRSMAKTLKGFCLVYLTHHFSQPPGIYQDNLMRTLSDPHERFLDIIGFRGCAKSTDASLALPLWAALEHPDYYPFILPVADTGLQAAMNIANIKEELDNNLLIKQDYGNIEGEFVEDWDLESEEEWQAKNMLLSSGVRILARSRGQKVRGLKHRQYRPMLVIIDDPEDLEWTQKKENRDKTERWVLSEVIPGIDAKNGRVAVIGNRLHMDALMARLAKNPNFHHIEIPIVEEREGKEVFFWPAMWPDNAALDKLKSNVGPVAFQREYKLKAVAEEGQPIKEEWLQYYDHFPLDVQGYDGEGVDLAISKKETADRVAMVAGTICTIDGKPKIFIDKYPVNERLTFHETIVTAKGINGSNPNRTFFVEKVAYQQAAIEEMQRNLLPVIGMPATTDKRARLLSVAPYIQNGTVVFPSSGCEDLIIQLLGFGVEAHDDLVDALVHLILGLVQNYIVNCEVVGL